ncbi:ABC transporter substrate-binding protein [Oryzibacter oryziterrae]|uniref:ABC transporter substrate-binding protein n=1 Tax=Oryzibacter oryziterrae TaxID=2766474 RepID=UPI001F4725AE|nr:ABC transporter substrate-binding protein [Oryzibacter oryziterrae]
MSRIGILKTALIALAATTALPVVAYAFQEAPMLADEVKAGKLPPVDQRLPKNPPVLAGETVGTYGGTWHRAYKGPGDRWGPTKLIEERVVKFQQDKDGKLSLMPGYIENYSVNADATEFTFTLLDGLKWSDGVPVTTDDVKFWYEDVFTNPDVVPTIDTIYAPGGKHLEVEIVDARTFKVKFATPYIYFLDILAKDSTGEPSLDRASFIMPAHYLKNFLPKYSKAEDLDKVVAAKGVKKWQDLWGSKGPITAWNQNPDLPVITAYKITVPPPADVMVMERNPYYWRVDSAGNQLPYIDHIEHKLFDNPETFNLMIVQGQIDMQQRYVQTGDFTFLKENEEKGGYKVLKWVNAETWSIVPNYNVKDAGIAKLLGDIKIREALSIGIDRDTINELGFAGLGEGRQAAPVTGSPYFNADLEKHWAEYDADKANKLLDEAGLDKKDADGFRLGPDGKRVTFVVEYAENGMANVLELIRTNWKDIGIELQPRLIDRTAFDANRDNNDFVMQFTSFDRLSDVPSDPRLMLGNDGFAQQYYVWYQTHGEKGIEPPKDDAIRTSWADWEKASTAATREAADAATNDMIANFVNNGWVIGVVGETPALAVVSAKVHNVRDGLTNDDVTRGEGLAYPAQIWMDQK